MRSKEAEQKSDIPELIQEREDCRAVINELYAKIKDLRADFKVKQDEYYERQRELRQQQQEEQAERQEFQLNHFLFMQLRILHVLLLCFIYRMHSCLDA